MLMADSSTRFSSISIFPVSERRRKWPSASIAKEIRVSVTLAPKLTSRGLGSHVRFGWSRLIPGLQRPLFSSERSSASGRCSFSGELFF
jgi:hypothetical protein